MAKPGRPFGSKIRQNLIEILFYLGEGYGYELHKLHEQLFKPCTKEVIYYHLKRGVERNEFEVKEVKIESGNFSWGPQTRKIIYKLGTLARPHMTEDIKEPIEQFLKERNTKT